MSITSIKYHPISKTQLRPPLAPSGTCGASSLPEGAVFPLAFAFSHWIFGNRKCLLWNPSVKNQRFLPAPFGKGAFGVHRRSPPCQRGVPRHRRGGGIPQAGRFPHGFVLSESASCESLSQKSKIFASSLSQGSLRAVTADNFARQLSTTRYFPDPPGIGGLSAEPITYSLFPKKSGIGTAVQASFGDG